MALSGRYRVDGVDVEPAFEALRRHVGRYTTVEPLTTVPAARIRALAAALARDARIGETIEVGGVRLPLRPVAVNFKMGAVAHKHGMATALAIHLINVVLGAIDVPGGFLGVNPVGPYWAPEEGPDGMLVPGEVIRHLFGYNSAFPGTEVADPAAFTLREVLPVAILGRAMYPFTIRDPSAFGVSLRPRVLIHARVNLMMSSLRPADMEDVLRRIPFMVSFATEIDETAEFADIVLPDAHDLERDDVFPANHPFAFVAPGPTPWYWTRRRAAVAPRGEARHWMEVMIDLLHRLGLSDAFYRAANELLDLPPEHALDPGGRYRIAEMAERQVASFGPRARADRPAFEGGSTWVTGERTAAEMYPGPFLTARIPVYNEYFLGKGRAVRAWAERLGIDWETVDYQPLPDFRPVADDEQPDPRYDLYAVTYKLGFMALGRGPLNPWLSELAESHPYAYRIWLSRAAAEARGIAEGDWVAVESRSGRVEGIAHVSEGIHPEAVGIAGIHGHWARQAGAAAGNGVHFNALLGMRTGIVDKLSSAFDAKPRVRVERLAGGERRA